MVVLVVLVPDPGGSMVAPGVPSPNRNGGPYLGPTGLSGGGGGGSAAGSGPGNVAYDGKGWGGGDGPGIAEEVMVKIGHIQQKQLVEEFL